MKKYHKFTITILALSLAGCYVPQNFNNQVQISRTGQYQVDFDTDIVSARLLAGQAEAKAHKQEISADDLKKLSTQCEDDFNYIVAQDAKNGKHILSSKYSGGCRGHLTLKYAGNIIEEKTFHNSIGNSEVGFKIPLTIKYDAKNKQIVINGKTKVDDKKTLAALSSFQYNGKLNIKTDGKVISTNADSKPYWGLIGSYKWDVKDMTTPDASMIISTSGI